LADDKAVLVATLDAQRKHVVGILDGLSEDDFHRPVLPTGWSCAGLLNHLAFDVERFWFEAVVAGRPDSAPPEAENAWQVGRNLRADEVLGRYRREIERADAVIDETSLDAAPAWWPEDLFGTWRLADLRRVILHVIAETACHAGHLDATRELIDGRTWLVLT
jgi:uncharacterized damage-inducible protein DinB